MTRGLVPCRRCDSADSVCRKYIVDVCIPESMAFDGRVGIVDIDEDEKTVIFDTYRLKKITGTRVAPILGLSEFSSPFKVACELVGLYPGDKANKYIDAGNILEPVLREYLGTRVTALLKEPLGVGDGVKLAVEEPVPKEQCGYDHFHNEKVFGGMVDGYIQEDGKRAYILEIKTSGDREKWRDEQGGYTNVPISYMLQACCPTWTGSCSWSGSWRSRTTTVRSSGCPRRRTPTSSSRTGWT